MQITAGQEKGMKFKNKGRKIYKTKEKNYYGKSAAGKAFSVGLTILLIGGIGFIGYSVAEPLVNYSKKKGDKDAVPATAAVTTTEIAEITTAALTDASGEIIPPRQSANFEAYKAAALKETDLLSMDALELAIGRLPTGQEIEYLEVPLKVKGGAVYYQSNVFLAGSAKAYPEMLTLEQIVQAVEKAGYKPAAIISTFNDNLLPAADGSAGYRTYNTDEQWIDNDPAAGGKPWATPYSELAVNYNADIAGEISSAGFQKVICADFVFPQFRQTDLDILDPELATPARSMKMTAAANLFNERILKNGSSMFVEVSAADIIKGSTDVLQPMLLNVNTVVLNLDIDELSSGVYTSETVYDFSGSVKEKAEKAVSLVEDELSDFNVVIRLSGKSPSMMELIEARDALVKKGYRSFVLG